MNFDWKETSGRGFLNRYPNDARGVDRWVMLIERFIVGHEGQALNEEAGYFLNEAFYRARPFGLDKAVSNTTVFISHRQADDIEARKAAAKLRGRGIDVWLDVEDPLMQKVSNSQNALLIAMVIEMALLNSTHVLALMTANTKGSLWIPYEYGRVKRSTAIAQEAASLHLVNNVNPHYTYLGTRLHRFDDLLSWP